MLKRKYKNGGNEKAAGLIQTVANVEDATASGDERQIFANYLKTVEGTDAVMTTTPSLIKKKDGTYYMALEDGTYYPYKDLKDKVTIGYGRHNSTILKDYPKGISTEQANAFLLEDIDKKYTLAGKQFNNRFGEDSWDKLSETEKYMITDFTYNPGKIFPIFSKALLDKDYETALNEYTRVATVNGVKLPLGRNDIFKTTYLDDWVNTQKEYYKNLEKSLKEDLKPLPGAVKDNTNIVVPGSGDANPFGGWKMGGMRLRKHGGMHSNQGNLYSRMKQLPGGLMMQIPGSDAVEFRGQTHKEGGILLDAQSEVEDGETMDKVVSGDGQFKDYFFSSHLKKDGKSYAQIHKEILARGGGQEEINYLAMMQEKAAKRDPKQIAKLGGVAMYKEGGEKDALNPSQKDIKSYQKEKYAHYKRKGGILPFRTWQKKHPFNLDEYLEYEGIEANIEEVSQEPITTEGLRVDLDRAYGYEADRGDGYTICQSGNCENGTGIMYTYYTDALDEQPTDIISDGQVIGMYEGEFVDGKPTGNGRFTWNDLDASEEQGVPFVAWGYHSEGVFGVDEHGHPTLLEGTKDYSGGELNIERGIFENDNLVSGTITTPAGGITNIENGETTDKFSYKTSKLLSDKNLITLPEFKYSQGDISTEYSAMEDFGKYKQPTKEELNARGYSSFDEFRADYERYVPGYDWNNVTDWGKRHQNAWDKLTGAIDQGEFVPTGSYDAPIDASSVSIVDVINNNTVLDDGTIVGTTFDEFGNVRPVCEYNPMIFADDPNCKPPLSIQEKEDKEKNQNLQRNLFSGMEDVPPLSLVAGAAQLAPAYYAFTHDQPDPEQVQFESGVTSPIVPGRLRAQKLSHINMNAQRSANEANYREFNKFIDSSGLGPGSIANRMAAWGRKLEGDMQIAGAEKQANINIANQNAMMQNQTDLHNLKMEQEAALGNAQMQQAEAQRLTEVNAINTAARNKIRDDEEYMKYAGVISGAQGIGTLFGDMLAYQGDMLKAKGLSIEGTTERMLLRRHLGKTLTTPDGTVFCESCTQADIAKYYQTYMNPLTQTE